MSRSRREDEVRRRKPGRPRRGRPGSAGKRPCRFFLSARAIRDAVESVAVALVLAFLFRAFAAQAFIIPTGSMASTLMGRHKDVVCLKCGYPYRVGASEEMDESGRPTGYRIIAGTCPMCRFTMDLGSENAQGMTYPSYSGDRIFVGRPNYYLGSPRRWDVAVFQYPLKASIDYVKRVAGLPGETVRI